MFALLEESEIQGRLMWRFIRVSTGVRQCFRFSGGYRYFGTMTNWDRLSGIRGEGNEICEKYIRKGQILDDDGVGGLSISIEYGHLGASGVEVLFDPTDAEARQATAQMAVEVSRLGMEKYKYTLPAASAEEHNMLGPQLSNYQLWQRKIKKALDPNLASDPSGYIKP